MNDNFSDNNRDNIPVTPYRAAGNLNTVISNPSANINDTMNINIQNVSTPNNSQVVQQAPVGNPPINNQYMTNANNQNIQNINQSINPTTINNSSQNNIQSKKYVSLDNKPKKKTVSIKIGSEFKIVLLIVVILLVFIFLFPTITDLFTRH